MGKLSRRERRERQVARATTDGDVAAIRALAERAPERAVDPLATLLRAGGANDEVVDLAVTVARVLRKQGSHAHVVALAHAGASRSRRLRAEGALAAIAAGDDATARDLAVGDASVNDALVPVLDALAAVAPTRPKTKHPLAAGLFAAAKSVFEAGAGKRERAKAALASLDPKVGEGVGAKRLRAAVELGFASEAGVARAVDTLLDDARVRSRPEVVDAVVAEALAKHPDLSLGYALERRGLGGDAARLARMAAMRASAEGKAAHATRRGSCADLTPDDFDGEQRGRAWLHQGFDLLRSGHAARADASFDRAIAAGGDLVEALRGKATVPHVLGKPREAATALERLARALERDPDGRPFAVATLSFAAQEWLEAEAEAAALAALSRARAMLPEGDASKLASDLDNLEARAVLARDPERAETILSRITARDPRDRDAWAGRLAIARRQRDDARHRQLLAQAVEATGDAGLADLLRAQRAKDGTLGAFEGLLPGAVKPADLAAELRRLLANGGDLDRALFDRFRGPLTPESRLAVDAAAIAHLEKLKRHDEARTLWRDGAAVAVQSPQALERHVHVALHFKLDELVLQLARERALDAPRESLVALFTAAACGGSRLANGVLAAVHARLDAVVVRDLRRLATRGRPRELIEPTLEAIESEVGSLSGEPASEFDPFAGPFDAADAFGEVELDNGDAPMLHALFMMLGRPCAPLHALDPTTRARFERTMEAFVAGGAQPGPAAEEVFRRLGVSMDDILGAASAHLGPGAPEKKPKNRKPRR